MNIAKLEKILETNLYILKRSAPENTEKDNSGSFKAYGEHGKLNRFSGPPDIESIITASMARKGKIAISGNVSQSYLEHVINMLLISSLCKR